MNKSRLVKQKRKRAQLFKSTRLLLVAVLLSAFQISQAQTTFKGKVMDESSSPIPGATVVVKGTTTGTITDLDGNYMFTTEQTGPVTLQVSYIGYSNKEANYDLKGGETLETNFDMSPDLIGLDVAVITGNANSKSKLESSTAISTISPQQIQRSGTRGTGDLAKTLPGVFVNAAGGEGNSNIEVRGNPSNGGAKFVQLQEDGMPQVPYGDLMFGNSDMFTRIDNTMDRLEVIRGGSAAYLASNAPGGIINIISKTGREEGGSVSQQVGLDWRHFRTDFEYGAPINDGLRYHIGGFFRSNEGVRSPGYTANHGGQIKMNVTKDFNKGKGYVRFYAKYLNDNTIPYIPIPVLRDNDDFESIKIKELEGFSATHGTFHSPDLLTFNATTPSGEEVYERLDGGMEPNLASVGAEAFFDLGNGWGLKNMTRFSDINHEFNGIFSFSGAPSTAEAFATNPDRFGLSRNGYAYQYVSGFGSGSDLSSSQLANLNGNGLVVEYGYWNVDMEMQYWTNQMELKKEFDNGLNLTLGYFKSQFDLRSVWWWHNVLTDVSDNTRRLDLINTFTGESLTVNGVSQFGSLHRDYSGTAIIDAPFFNIDFSPVENLTIDAGGRLDIGNIVGTTQNGGSYDYDVNGDGTISAAETGVAYGDPNNTIPVDFNYTHFSWSVGANYKLNEDMAVFARASEGIRFNFDRVFAFNATTATRSGYPENEQDGERAQQYEAGFKYRSPKFATFITGFHTRYPDLINQEQLFNDDGTPGELREVNTVLAVTGVEIEATAGFGDLRLTFNGTFMDRSLGDFFIQETDDMGNVTQRNLNGEQFRGVGSFFTFVPEYQFADKKGIIGTTLMYRGRSKLEEANDFAFAPYLRTNVHVGYNFTKNLSVMIIGSNIFNTLGVSEGNPRTQATNQTGDILFVRPILGRSINGTVTFTF